MRTRSMNIWVTRRRACGSKSRWREHRVPSLICAADVAICDKNISRGDAHSVAVMRLLQTRAGRNLPLKEAADNRAGDATAGGFRGAAVVGQELAYFLGEVHDRHALEPHAAWAGYGR